MKPEQQRKMLEAAAKACGFKKWRVLTNGLFQVSNNENWNEAFAQWTDWNPLTNPADTAEMCAKLGICTLFFDNEQKVSCGFLAQDKGPTLAHIEPYGDSRLKAWMYAATTVAAKIGGYEE